MLELLDVRSVWEFSDRFPQEFAGDAVYLNVISREARTGAVLGFERELHRGWLAPVVGFAGDVGTVLTSRNSECKGSIVTSAPRGARSPCHHCLAAIGRDGFAPAGNLL